jgi:dienelactone hydrolase
VRSAAETAGLKVGDIVTQIGAAPISNADSFVNRLKFLHAGEPVTVAVRRAGQPMEIQLVPDEAAREGDLEATVEYNAFAGSKGRLRSVWSFPKGATSPRPAVVIVRGVGASAADAPGNNSFRDLAFQLARAGVIVVRYDPEGVGDSEGMPNSTVDFDTEVADARAALAHARADARVDPDHVFVLGQGTGGGAATVIASSDPKVAGLLVVGMIARPLMEYLLDSRRDQMTLAGVPPGEIDDILHEHVVIYAGLVADGHLPASDPYGIVGPDSTLMGKGSDFWREYDKVNYSKLFSELKVPVLNAIGEFDFVSTLADHRAIADALKAKGQDGQVLVVFDRTDHDLRTFDSREAAFASFGSTDAPVSDRALGTIVDWVRAHLNSGQPTQ